MDMERSDRLTVAELRDAWLALSGDERVEGLNILPKSEAEDFFLALPVRDLAEVIFVLPPGERRSWLRLVPELQRLVGVVTVDDIVDVVQDEATEDIQKFGGMEALDAPYLNISFGRMVKKRAGWLSALFLGEMLTTTAMAYFEAQIARALVLVLFLPLIMSSGGNSGSQASTLVIRAMALGEVNVRDWWRVVRREIAAGLTLGAVLGAIGFLRIVIWQSVSPIYGEHYILLACTIFCSLLGVVSFGTIAGSFLPFVLRRFGFDPASASAPFVATLVDVTALIIYFGIATFILAGTLL